MNAIIIHDYQENTTIMIIVLIRLVLEFCIAKTIVWNIWAQQFHWFF